MKVFRKPLVPILLVIVGIFYGPSLFAQSKLEYKIVLDSFITAFSKKDGKRLLKTYHPGYFFVDADGNVIAADEDHSPPPLFETGIFDNPGWQTASLGAAEVIQSSNEKVHVTANIDLFDENGEILERHPALFMINRIDDKVRIFGISFLRTIQPNEFDTTNKIGPDAKEKVMNVLNDFMTTFSARDVDKHCKTHYFPHFRLVAGKFDLYPTVDDYYVKKIPFFFFVFRLTTGFKWHHSKWNTLKIIQADAGKVHVATQFYRCKSDGSIYATIDSLYVVIRKNGQWLVLGRSSFAPM